ncbi:MAG: anti-sigma-I factor RsgI family protein [Candidatus Merdivicinus sp.]|jgi:hypothetical protein
MLEDRLKQSLGALQAEDSLRNAARLILSKQTPSRSRQKKIFLRYAVAMLCCLFIGGTALSYFTPVSAVSMDGEASLTLRINCFDRVIGVEEWDEEAQSVTQNLNLHNLFYLDAVEKILANGGQDFSPELTVSGSSGEKSDEMVQELAQCRQINGDAVSCAAVNSNLAGEAEEAGLSMGKYRLYLEWKTLDSTLEPDTLREMSMPEIRAAIQQEQSADESDPEEVSSDPPSGNHNSFGNGNGSGSGTGSGNKGMQKQYGKSSHSSDPS